MTTATHPTVEVRIPSMLRGATFGEKLVRVEGQTVAEVFVELGRRFPAFGDGLFEADGQLRKFVNVYVNDEDIRYLDRLQTRLKSGDSISILPAVAGGR